MASDKDSALYRRKQDITGEKHGIYRVLRFLRSPANQSRRIWECLCDCGQIVEKPTAEILRGTDTRCGYTCGFWLKAMEATMVGRVNDLATITGYAGTKEKQNGSKIHMWHLLCKCGEAFQKSTGEINTGKVKNCGKACKAVFERWLSGIVGKEYHRLKIVEHLGLRPVGKSMQQFFLAECNCPLKKRIEVTLARLVSGNTRSCGCLTKERLRRTPTNVKHRKAKSDEYKIWSGIKKRCYNVNSKAYFRYGGAGIVMCEEWKNSFRAFFRDVGPRPSKKHSIDRYPNQKGNYEPGNVRWATAKQQCRNRSSNQVFEIDGVSRTLAEWCEIANVGIYRVMARLKLGWPIQTALFAPKGSKCPDATPSEDVRRKIAARVAMLAAVRRGELIKAEKCEYPGCDKTKLQGHHHKGYDPENWLNVRWLCPVHHYEEGRKDDS